MNAPWKSGSSSDKDPYGAYVCDDATSDVIRSVVGEMGWAEEKCFKGGLRNAVQSLSVSASPQILLVDLSESGDPLNDINSLAEVCEPGTIVIAMGQVNDVRLYRDLIISGLHDYLLKPISPDSLRDAFAQAQIALTAPKHEENAGEKIHISTAVIGTRGGVGASTIATSLAWIFSEKKGHSTGYLDLDVHFGTGALTLDLEPGRGLTDAIDNPSRIDGLFIERAMIKANDKLAILSAEASMNNPLMSDGSAFYQLQEEFRASFEATVIDLPRNMLVNYPHLVHDVNVNIVVCELTLASARDAIRIIAWLKSNSPNSKIFIVANKTHSSGSELSRKDFEDSIDMKIDLIIPADFKSMAQASKLGQPVVQAVSSSKISQFVTTLSDMVEGSAAPAEEGDEGKKSKSLFGKIGDLKSILSTKPKVDA
ncbi:pilus assembly protein CpaE [Sphingorhabdus lutea]|uniref:Pilus assembly protein CpaE n=1 Tax=Sphingorhabdus lutea TaxID=1913578 RepID=A0A1L3JD07_9SPHN|nr:pilus assembly protein CpaE [Sphingorhabdus lutea]APG63000.1 pilus assembly protein CpaE [Sphingorhabdus lutea]